MTMLKSLAGGDPDSQLPVGNLSLVWWLHRHISRIQTLHLPSHDADDRRQALNSVFTLQTQNCNTVVNYNPLIFPMAICKRKGGGRNDTKDSTFLSDRRKNQCIHLLIPSALGCLSVDLRNNEPWLQVMNKRG